MSLADTRPAIVKLCEASLSRDRRLVCKKPLTHLLFQAALRAKKLEKAALEPSIFSSSRLFNPIYITFVLPRDGKGCVGFATLCGFTFQPEPDSDFSKFITSV